jgi:hypothetical protein
MTAAPPSATSISGCLSPVVRPRRAHVRSPGDDWPRACAALRCVRSESGARAAQLDRRFWRRPNLHGLLGLRRRSRKRTRTDLVRQIRPSAASEL